ncbi:MAG: hypothetical protein ACKO96_00495 [Flammeovirgaceae bacterium]
MKSTFLFLSLQVLLSIHLVAHSPDVSSILIYEQNGQTNLLVRSSLDAFESEIIYRFGKNSYKNSNEFIALVLKDFKNHCKIKINGSLIEITNLELRLGHETSLFCELKNIPAKIESLEITNNFFEDIPNNRCELILNIRDIALKQYLFDSGNKHSSRFVTENRIWLNQEETKSWPFRAVYWLAFFMILLVISLLLIKRFKNHELVSISNAPISN